MSDERNNLTSTNLKNLEEVSQFNLDDAEIERLYREQEECTVCWTTKDGWPVGMTHLYVWAEGSIWVTMSGQRKRVQALRNRPKSCIVITSKGTPHGPGSMVAVKTIATIHDDREKLRWFLPLFLDRAKYPKERFDLYFTPRRIVVEFKPQEKLSFSQDKLRSAMGASGHSDALWNRGNDPAGGQAT